MNNFAKNATVKRTNTGSWAAHVVSRSSGKKVLLGTYSTESAAWTAVREYAGEPKKQESQEESVPKQQILFSDD